MLQAPDVSAGVFAGQRAKPKKKSEKHRISIRNPVLFWLRRLQQLPPWTLLWCVPPYTDIQYPLHTSESVLVQKY